jgi:hypothetical protein
VHREKDGLNEPIVVTLTRREVLLIMLCINTAFNHSKGGALLYDLECLREKVLSESGITMYSAS